MSLWASTTASRLRSLALPTIVDVFFCVLLLASLSRPGALESLLLDGDTGWHIRTGELVVARGAVPALDPFSFSRPAEPWFAWEWGSDVLFFFLWRSGGLAAVAAGCASVIAASAAVLFSRLLRSGAGMGVALVASLIAVSASSVHFLARPHVFSILLYSVALGAIETDRRRESPRVWLLLPLTALWANLHAGFAAWLATVALLSAGYCFQREWRRARRYALLLAGCAAASLANPYGWRLHAHVAAYLNSSWVMNHVAEFQSPSIRSEATIVYALLLLTTAAVAARAEWFHRALALAWAFASMRSARHIPFFAIVAATLLAEVGATTWGQAAERKGRESLLWVMGSFFDQFGRASRVTLWSAAAVAIVFVRPAPVGFPALRFPVSAVEQNLARVSGPVRTLTSDQWADYLIYRLPTGRRIFFDGRSDFFGEQIGGDYRKLFAAEQGWRELVDRYQFTVALLPHDWPLSTMLDREPGWSKVYQDDVGVLFQRKEAI